MWLTNDPEGESSGAPKEWKTWLPSHDQRVIDWILHLYREKHPPGTSREVHMSTCPEITVVLDVYDGDCNDEACNCQWVHLDSVLTCPHGVRRDFDEHMVVAGDVEGLLAHLERYELHEREQRGQHKVHLGTMEGAAELSMIVIYRNPSDFPGMYVVRQRDIGPGQVAIHPLPMIVTPSLEEARAVVPLDMVRLAPADDEDPCILEVYV